MFNEFPPNPIVLTGHQVEGSDNNLTIKTTDAPGNGGDHHRYEITGPSAGENPSRQFADPINQFVVLFQNGPVPKVGVNGITMEALLAISIHRLQCLQAGPFPSDDNQQALEHLEQALECLHRRTRERIAREVQGKEIK